MSVYKNTVFDWSVCLQLHTYVIISLTWTQEVCHIELANSVRSLLVHHKFWRCSSGMLHIPYMSSTMWFVCDSCSSWLNISNTVCLSTLALNLTFLTTIWRWPHVNLGWQHQQHDQSVMKILVALQLKAIELRDCKRHTKYRKTTNKALQSTNRVYTIVHCAAISRCLRRRNW